METCNKSKLTMQEKKTIEGYCEDIIQARYYDLSKLKELNIVKAVYDENNIVKWYIDGFDEEYTSYRELRAGLENYVWRLHNGEYFRENEMFETLGKIISSQKPTMILTKCSTLKVTSKLMFRIVSQAKKTQLAITGRFSCKFEHHEKQEQSRWESLEERMWTLFNSPFWINEVEAHSITEYQRLEESIKNKKVMNLFIDTHPGNVERSEILAWGKELGVNVYFIDLGLTKSSNSAQLNRNSFGDIFAEGGRVIWLD